MKNTLNTTEYEIMKFIWTNSQNGVSFGEIHDFINTLGKQQSRQRVNCYIKTLTQKDFLTSFGEERHKIYIPKIPKEVYDKQIANDVLNQLFDGSVKNFICALSGGKNISEETAIELKRLLRNRKG